MGDTLAYRSTMLISKSSRTLQKYKGGVLGAQQYALWTLLEIPHNTNAWATLPTITCA